MAFGSVTIDNGGLTDFAIATDLIAGVHSQIVKIGDGTEGSTATIEGTAAFGLEVDVTRIAAGTAIQLTDGTDVATISVAGSRKPLDMHLIDSAGNVISTFGGAGGTSATDDADFTQGATVATPIMGVFESSPTSVTATDMGVVGITATRSMKIAVTESSLDVAHSVADTGDPVKTGAKAHTALPTAVANNARANNVSDVYGRQLVSHIDPAMQIWKSFNATTTQTGALIWDPAAGKKIAITHLYIATYGTTAARLILFFASTADTTYTAGTDQLVFAGSFAPSTTVKPGALPPMMTPIFAATADHELKITTDAALSVDVAVYGYEFS